MLFLLIKESEHQNFQSEIITSFQDILLKSRFITYGLKIKFNKKNNLNY